MARQLTLHRCRFTFSDGKLCHRIAREGWTTCNRHYTAGMSRAQWKLIHKPKEDN